jgi:hypothetical protein
MFPDRCGADFAEAVAQGAHPDTVVPDNFYVVHGGQAPLAFDHEISCSVGPTLEAAAAAVPHGAIRWTTAMAIRIAGGTIRWVPELSRYAILNEQHVNVTVVGADPFSVLQRNPVARVDRIGGRP